MAAPPGRIRSAPAGTPYHRLARTTAHRWWRPMVGTLLVLVVVPLLFVLLAAPFWIAAELTGQPDDADGIASFGPLADTALLLLSLGVMTPVVLLAARWVQARPAGSVSSVTGRLRWRWLAVCLLLSVPTVTLMVGGLVGLLVVTGDWTDADTGPMSWVGLRTLAISMAVLLPLVPLQAAAEEYLCRGWLLQAVGAYLRSPWIAIVPQALLFAAAHGWGTRWGFADLTLFGLVTGWLTVRTGGLEAAIGLHVVNNLVALGLAAATGDLASDATAADAPWHLLAVNLFVMVGYALVVDRLAARRGLAATVPA
ncbi:CPBP family intramembrane glutamic endopeptidase [Micromonospora zingiberis]|uniref:CPBP family intramembrane glutamic endopeptidase n=1 Tax=Micromonospora zingiberis TaxID=2053011 RepID=UPI00197ED647|nr:type II CAAX endopeptidase family protein [Micromonospora zingiberis]